MNKVLLGLKPIIYIKDGTTAKLYVDLSKKRYDFAQVTQVTFLFSQNRKECVYFEYYDTADDNKRHGVEMGYDEDKQRVWMKLDFGSEITGTDKFLLNSPIDFEVAITTFNKPTGAHKTATDIMPKIIITENDNEKQATLFDLIQD